MAGKYELKKAAGGKFMWNLKAPSGEIILTSELYEAKQSAQKGIESVKRNSPHDERYDRRKSKADEPYFVLKAPSGEGIGNSEMYKSNSGMENGIASCKANGPTGTVQDLT